MGQLWQHLRDSVEHASVILRGREAGLLIPAVLSVTGWQLHLVGWEQPHPHHCLPWEWARRGSCGQRKPLGNGLQLTEAVSLCVCAKKHKRKCPLQCLLQLPMLLDWQSACRWVHFPKQEKLKAKHSGVGTGRQLAKGIKEPARDLWGRQETGIMCVTGRRHVLECPTKTHHEELNNLLAHRNQCG